jgi:hypothetical protein
MTKITITTTKIHHLEEKSNTKYSVICTRKHNYTAIRTDLGDYKFSVLHVNKA